MTTTRTRSGIVAMLCFILAAIVLLLAPGVQASGSDGSWIRVYEERPRSYGDVRGDHALVYKVDTGNISNLNNFSLGLFIGCDNGDGDWNNCISTVYYSLDKGTCVRLYDYYSYGTVIKEIKNTRSSGWVSGWTDSDAWDNRASSIRWGNYDYFNKVCVMGTY